MYMNDLDLINIYMNMHLDCRILKQLMLWYMEILFYLYAYVHKYLFKKLSFLRDIYNTVILIPRKHSSCINMPFVE